MSNQTILIVDKNEEHLDLLSSRLDARGYTVLVSTTSQKALHLIMHEVPALVLLDSEMESVNGTHLALSIKRQVHDFFMPIIMMTEKDNISRQVMGMESGFDDIIIKPFSPFELSLRITMNLKRASETVQANPLTKLPGNIAIERTINERINSGKPYSVCYIDVNNFKSFNDKYGFDKGDDVLVQTARILVRVVQELDDESIFIGHVGGDDFVLVMTPEREQEFAQRFISEFDRIIPTHYARDDQERGMIEVKNRRGKTERFPIMSVSVAAVTNIHRTFANLGEIAATAAEVKKFLKTQLGSNYLRDRREAQIESIKEAADVLKQTEDRRDTTEPLGQVLLAAGLITEDQLQEALKKHFSTGQRLGRVLINMNVLSSEKVGLMLEKKLGVRYASLSNRVLTPKLQRLFTEEYIRTHGVVPLEITEEHLFVAMIDPFDLNTIDDIERITGLKVSPRITLEEEFAEFVDTIFTEGR